MRIATVSALVVAAAAGVAQAQTIVGVTVQNNIVTFDRSTPGTLISNVGVSGLASGEQLLSIDLRPATGQIYGITSGNRVVIVDAVTGAATPVGSGFTPALSTSRTSTNFNPTVDRMRVVSADTSNRRLNPITGASVSPAADTNLTIASSTDAPFIVATAYNNSLAGVPVGSVRQFVIDSRSNRLGEVGSQAGGNASFNGGVITFFGNLGVAPGSISENVGFDIFGPTGEAFVSLQNVGGGSSSFGTIDLGTGAFTAIDTVGGGVGLRTLTAIPAPGAAALLGLAGLAAARRRRA